VNPTAVRVAAERGLDLRNGVPKGYDDLSLVPDLVISVCDQAREAERPQASAYRHWSVPDPVPSGKVSEFRRAFGEIDDRIERLAGQIHKGG
jgi:protein-tyrosine-phosphatase